MRVRFLMSGVCVAAVVACGSPAGSRTESPIVVDPGTADPDVRSLIRAMVDVAQVDPANAGKRARLGMAYEANGLIDAAQRSYRQALAIDDSHASWWYRLAIVEARRGDHDAAIEAVNRAARLAPSYAPAHWRLGFWLLDRGDSDAAAAAFTRAIEAAPADPAGRLGLARAYLVKHQEQRAIETLRTLLSNDRTHLLTTVRYANHLLGRAYRQLGRVEEARAALALGDGNEPSWDDAWSDEVLEYRRGFASARHEAAQLVADGKVVQAIHLLEKLRQQKPDDRGLMNQLASAYITAARPDEALAVLHACLAKYPDDVEAHVNAASVYLRMGKLDRALDHADLALDQHSGLAKAYEIKGLALFQARRFGPALEAFEAAVHYDGRSATALAWSGMVLGELRRYDEALSAFARASQIDPRLADAYIGTGMVHIARGNPGQAQAALNRAFALDPDHPQLKAALRHLRK